MYLLAFIDECIYCHRSPHNIIVTSTKNLHITSSEMVVTSIKNLHITSSEMVVTSIKIISFAVD